MKGPSLAGLDAEIRDHIERETRDNIAQGMPREVMRNPLVVDAYLGTARA